MGRSIMNFNWPGAIQQYLAGREGLFHDSLPPVAACLNQFNFRTVD